VKDLEETIRRSDAEFVVDGSPVDLGRLVHVPQPIISVRYQYDDLGNRVEGILTKFLKAQGK
jgi:YD repeat-containing protein